LSLSSDTFSIKVSTLIFDSIFGLKLLSVNGNGESNLTLEEDALIVSVELLGDTDPELNDSLALSFNSSKLGDLNKLAILSFRLFLLTNSISRESGESLGFIFPELFVGIMGSLLLLFPGLLPPPGRLEKIHSINAAPPSLISSK
jgi:hypothetical protein